MSEKTIDEQLAEEQAKFDARLLADGTTKKVALSKAKVRPNPKVKKPGMVAHTHDRERGDEIVAEPCLYVDHYVNDAVGFRINEQRYRGHVIVPQCVADYLSMMQSRAHASERNLFNNKGGRLNYGEIKG